MGSFVGRWQLVKVLYCKLLTRGKQLPAFSHKVWGVKRSEVGGECITTAPLWPLGCILEPLCCAVDIMHTIIGVGSEYPNSGICVKAALSFETRGEKVNFLATKTDV